MVFPTRTPSVYACWLDGNVHSFWKSCPHLVLFCLYPSLWLPCSPSNHWRIYLHFKNLPELAILWYINFQYLKKSFLAAWQRRNTGEMAADGREYVENSSVGAVLVLEMTAFLVVKRAKQWIVTMWIRSTLFPFKCLLTCLFIPLACSFPDEVPQAKI